MTLAPLVRDSATFSAAWRQMLQRRNSASPSFHSPVWRSKVRGVDATVKFATAAPEGVNRNSGSAVRLPTTVMMVSPAIRYQPQAFAAALAAAFFAPRGGRRRMTLVRITVSWSESCRSSSETASGSA